MVDRLTKSAHFLPIRIKYSMERLAQVYIREIVKLHGVPESIVSDRDPRFQSDFGEAYPKLWALSCNSVQRHTPDRWTVREDYSNIGRYADDLCIRF